MSIPFIGNKCGICGRSYLSMRGISTRKTSCCKGNVEGHDSCANKYYM